MTRDRLGQVRRLLAEAGIDAPVRVAGTEGDIVAVTGAPELREPLARLAPALRKLGFRYVALELENGSSTSIRDS